MPRSGPNILAAVFVTVVLVTGLVTSCHSFPRSVGADRDADGTRVEFITSEYEVILFENFPIGGTLVYLNAVVVDDPNAQVVCELAPKTQQMYGDTFGISESESGIPFLYVRGSLDYESVTLYHLAVEARAVQGDGVLGEAWVTVEVRDMNDNAPQITINTLTSGETAEIAENAGVGTFIGHISVVDYDSGENQEVGCTLHDDSFELRQLYSSEFIIVTRDPLDRETVAEYSVTVQCMDHGDPPLNTTSVLTIVVVDVNDHSPEFSSPVYTAEVTENNMVGQMVLQVEAVDRDTGKNALVRYSIREGSGSGLFQVDSETGVIQSKVSLDREQMERVQFEVLATDYGQPERTGWAIVLINILDTDDNVPKFTQATYSFPVDGGQPGNILVGTIVAKDADSPPFCDIKYSLRGEEDALSKFEIEEDTGNILTKDTLDMGGPAVYNLNVVAANPPPISHRSTASVRIHVIHNFEQ